MWWQQVKEQDLTLGLWTADQVAAGWIYNIIKKVTRFAQNRLAVETRMDSAEHNTAPDAVHLQKYR